MPIEIQRYNNVSVFRDAIDDFVRADLNEYSQLFTHAQCLTQEQADSRQAWLVRLHRSGHTCGLAMIHSVPPVRTIALSSIDDESAACIAAALVADDIKINGVFGRVHSANLLTKRLGLHACERARMGNHVLDTEPVLAPCHGRMRAATLADFDLLVAWEGAFVLECGLPDNRNALPAEIMARLSGSVPLMWIWEVDEGTAKIPVAMALGRPCQPIGRVAQVYTPSEYRGCGYAGALVAMLSSNLQAQGCSSVFLFTDLANPTSNGVYRRIGYRYLDEFTLLDVY
jgi:predicted GNAT family acetyltransferase